MDISKEVMDLPGNVTASVFKIEPQRQLTFEQKKQTDPLVRPETETETYVYEHMASTSVHSLPKKTWGRTIEIWDPRNDKDKEKKAQFAEAQRELKKKIGDKQKRQNISRIAEIQQSTQLRLT